MQVITNNAISWAAIRLQGGWKNILLTAGGYAAFIVAVVMTAAQFATVPLAALMYNLLVALLAAQGGWLLLFAPSRIQASVRRDISNGMIESHRLMPLPPTHAVAGYLLGPTAQPMSLVAATFLVGCFVAHAASVALPRWLVANLLLLELAAVVWVVVGTAALHNAQVAFLAVFVVTPSIMNGNVAHVLPGAILLIPPITGKTIVQMQGQLDRVHVIGFALHAVIVAVFVRAAARRYVRSDAPAMTPLMGLMLLACWSVASIVAMRLWDEVRPAAWRWGAGDLSGATMICTIAVGLLLAVAPLTQAVRPGAGSGGQRRSWLLILTPLAVLLLAIGLTILPATFAPSWIDQISRQRALHHTAIAISSVALSVCLLARAFYLQGVGAWMAIAIWLVLTCVGPIAYDAGHHALLGDGSEFQLGAISNLSPVGALHAAWIRGEEPAWSAAVVQATFAALAAALLFTSHAVARWRGVGGDDVESAPAQ